MPRVWKTLITWGRWPRPYTCDQINGSWRAGWLHELKPTESPGTNQTSISGNKIWILVCLWSTLTGGWVYGNDFSCKQPQDPIKAHHSSHVKGSLARGPRQRPRNPLLRSLTSQAGLSAHRLPRACGRCCRGPKHCTCPTCLLVAAGSGRWGTGRDVVQSLQRFNCAKLFSPRELMCSVVTTVNEAGHISEICWELNLKCSHHKKILWGDRC